MLKKKKQIRSISEIHTPTDYILYSKDIIHSYSPGIGNLLDLYMNHLNLAFERKKEQKEVIYSDGFNSVMFYACDATPIDVPDMARLQGEKAIHVSEDILQIPQETCPMVKTCAGSFYLLKNQPVHKAVISSFMCEPQQAIMEMMKSYGYEPYEFDMIMKPNNADQLINAYKHFENQLNKLSIWMCGAPLDENKLYEEMKHANYIHDRIDYLHQLQKKHPDYMKSLPYMLLISARESYYGQPELYEEILEQIISEYEELPEGAFDDNNVHLAWSGARGVDFSVYNAFDMLGACVTGWNISGSGKARYDLTKRPIEAYTEYLLKGNYLFTNMSEQNEADAQLTRECGAKGMILYLSHGCTSGTIRRELKQRYLNEQGIPTLAIDGTVQTGEASGQILTRIKAFVEMLT